MSNSVCTLYRLHIKQGFAQATLLAIPGGVVVATLLAICAYYVMPFHWSLTYSFLFGAILCATDPVSVVDLLKRTGASSKLSTVIAGESLLNDGSAMILYFFVLNLLKGKTYTAATFLEFIARMLILSPAIGFVSGFIAYALMRKLIHPTNLNMDAQIALSFVCAYVSFYVAEGLADVSGVLACCTAGVTLALFVNPQVLYHDRMHMIWHYAEWVCNTLIFLLGGLIGGDHAGNLATLNNIGYVVAMYALVQGTRMVMVGLFYPVVSRIGMKCSFNDALFMSFAGLRGALAIALALDSTTQADDFGDHYTGEQIFFVVTGVVSMTLLINGSAAGYVLFMLGLVDDPNSPVSPQKQQVLDRIKDFLRKLVRQEIGSITNFGDYDETEVMRLCRIMVTEGKNLLVTEEEIEMDRERNISRSMSRISGADVDDDLLTFLRSTYLDIVRARYIESIKTGKIGSSSTASKLLIYSVDAAIDTVRIGIYDWDVIERNLTTNKLLLRTAIIVDDISYFCGRPTAYTAYLDALYERIAIYVLTNYIEAHEYAMNKVHYYLGADDGNFDIAGPEERILLSQSNSVVSCT